MLFDAVRTIPAFIVVLLVSFSLQARLASGVPGALFLLGLTLFWALAYNGLFFAMALRTQCRVFMTSTPSWTPVWKALVAAAVIMVITQAFTLRSFRALVRGD